MHNNNNELTLSAPLSGPVLALRNVPDPVFASGAMGDGIAIDPLNDTLHAPCAGQVIQVARTGHAITLRAANGAELLLHLGLDTVELQGEGFAPLVKEGQQVRAGQPLLRVDLDYVAQHCRSLISLLILTNGEGFDLRPLTLSAVQVGEPLLHISRRANTAPQPLAQEQSEQQASARIKVAHRGGLHARPAALVRQTALSFNSHSQLTFKDKSAPCTSLIALMSLGIGEQDEVLVNCLGADCQDALQAMLQTLGTAMAADAHGEIPAPVPIVQRPVEDGVLPGVCAAPGLVSGPLVRLNAMVLAEDHGQHPPEPQRQALNAALDQVRGEIRHTLEQARQRRDPQEQDIFSAHLALLDDPTLLDAAEAAIAQGRAATHAWSAAIAEQCQILQQLGSTLLAERANDLRDLQQRVLRALLGEAW
ncbi:glucose PTS transporter subunit IIA, partial [Pseudomonas protegens]|uniref:glucose PTS transporter subunit IIA n=1 Tax=Pseudomonas protegens TaxID=380021 RepID=UPI00223AFD7B